MKDAFYFSHDMGARNDPKIKAMMIDYGRKGYGWFWMLVETLAEQSEYMMPCKKWAYASLASDFDCTIEDAQKYVQDCVEEYELLNTDGNHFWSESLLRRMVVKDQRRILQQERASKAGQASAAKRELNTSSDNISTTSTDVQQALNTSSTDVQQKPTKEKKRKEKKEYSPDSIEFRLANHLFERIRENNPGHSEPKLQTWADDIRLMVERDIRTPEQIRELIDWCQAHHFWHTNILSTDTLRRQWDKLQAQRLADIKKQPRGAPLPASRDPAAYYDPDPNGEDGPIM